MVSVSSIKCLISYIRLNDRSLFIGCVLFSLVCMAYLGKGLPAGGAKGDNTSAIGDNTSGLGYRNI